MIVMNRLILLFLLFIPVLAAPEVGGKDVILIVSDNRGDVNGEWLELTVRGMRHELGLKPEDLPVVRMGFKDDDAEVEHFERLGLKAEDSPIICLVGWSEDEKDGPTKVLRDSLMLKAAKEKGVEAPRSVFIKWLELNQLDSLISIIDPPPPPPEVVKLPDPGQVAFENRRYAEAIEWARKSEDTKLEEAAQKELEELGLLAIAEKQDQLALSVFRELLGLYPEEPAYQNRVKELSTTPADLISGRWKMKSASGWIKFTAHPDGRLEGKGALYLVPIPGKMVGHWEITGDTERTFQLHWKNGALHNIKVHENGKTFEGRGLSDGDVGGRRVEES